MANNSSASEGAHGKCSGNIERDFHRWTKGLYGMRAEPYHLWIDVHIPKADKVMPLCVPCLLIYEVMESIARAGSKQSMMSLLGARR